MKLTIKIIILLIGITSFSQNGQVNISIGTDPKIAILGTNNNRTEHDARLNYQLKVEYLDKRIYVAIGTEYVNLNSHYESWILDIGHAFEFKISNNLDKYNTIKVIPSLEIGEIFRELEPVQGYERNDSQNHYLGTNIGIRYQIHKLISIEAEGNVDFATDLPDRLMRFGGKINLIIHLKHKI